ncbi:MAG: EAL domain-containing protein [Solirubrobacterales bacterium]|nr:EAL domain-containing protein [Solirubrobacterales bacterium]
MSPASVLDVGLAAAPISVSEVIETRAVRSVYQPLIDLYSGETVGYEALSRGPRATSLERPDQLFGAARDAGLTSELEWACQRAAVEGALNTGLAPGQALFVNIEPGVSMSGRPADISRLGKQALARFPIFVELTERALTANPAELLANVARLRAMGARIALDDVGADPRSLALMPFLAPEVIKLDLRLVQENPSRQVAEIVHAVSAEAERTGALVLAEGIETEAHRQRALALGARYGQGWLFGRPADLPSPGRAVPDHVPEARADSSGLGSPFEIVTQDRPLRRGPKRLLLSLSLQIEAQAVGLGPSAVLLSTFQEAQYFTPITAGRYERIAREAALVGALGVGLPPAPALGVRGVALEESDPLRGEWDVTVIGSHFSMAFVARELGDNGADMERRFDFALTYERELALAAARAMMGRVAAL